MIRGKVVEIIRSKLSERRPASSSTTAARTILDIMLQPKDAEEDYLSPEVRPRTPVMSLVAVVVIR